jgi:hypothetical protein
VIIVGLSGATSLFRASIGPIRDDVRTLAFLRALVEEAVTIGRAEAVPLPDDQVDRTMGFLHSLPAAMKYPMLEDPLARHRLELPWHCTRGVWCGAAGATASRRPPTKQSSLPFCSIRMVTPDAEALRARRLRRQYASRRDTLSDRAAQGLDVSRARRRASDYGQVDRSSPARVTRRHPITKRGPKNMAGHALRVVMWQTDSRKCAGAGTFLIPASLAVSPSQR